MDANNIEREISILNHKFSQATKKFGNRNVSGTKLHELQVDYSYKIHNLKFAPDYIISKLVYNLYQYITEIDNIDVVVVE